MPLSEEEGCLPTAHSSLPRPEVCGFRKHVVSLCEHAHGNEFLEKHQVARSPLAVVGVHMKDRAPARKHSKTNLSRPLVALVLCNACLIPSAVGEICCIGLHPSKKWQPQACHEPRSGRQSKHHKTNHRHRLERYALARRLVCFLVREC